MTEAEKREMLEMAAMAAGCVESNPESGHER